ncbi:EAL domain-containing protein [Sulfurovum sp. zt1-1]|uniref:EAL domain-containing protein n=1 Tax=Sulfurovum zhangzhouensis TaxID=3019067 RepID=A0ABT7QVW8_9BACT|nr:bifunctional diguanylate cyclase/phosphodiesterase [Sulfurovum zhangzhouensis]MDM5270979.1 EAL domain-containing protein [Sulfurovum zhangzhouensis]
MNNLELLSLTYECESSLGKSLDLQEMAREFLKVFLKRTSALYDVLFKYPQSGMIDIVEHKGKERFYDLVVKNLPIRLGEYEIVHVKEDELFYYILYIPLDNHILTLVYNENIHIDIHTIANVFYSLRPKIDLGINACLEHQRIIELNKYLLEQKKVFKTQALRFQAILDQTPSIAVQGYNKHGKLIYWNKASEELYGYTREEALGISCGDILIPKMMQEQMKVSFDKWVNSGIKMVPEELVLQDKYGQDVYVYSQRVLIDIGDGEQEIYCLQMDLRHIKMTEAKLKKSEAKLLAAQQIAKLGNWEWNLQTNEMLWSDEIFRIFGEKPQGFIPNYDLFLTYITPSDRIRILRATIDAKKTGKTQRIEHKITRKDGSIRYLLSSGKGIFGSDRNFATIIGTAQDITEQKQVENMLEQKAQIIEQIHDSVIIMDLKGYIIEWNNTSVFNLGYSAEEIIGKHISNLYPKDRKHSLLKIFGKLNKYGVLRTEIELKNKSGGQFYGNLLLSYLKDDKGEKKSIIAYVENITQRKKAESELRRQKNMMEYRAYHDELTGLPNRSYFLEELERTINRVRRSEGLGALLFIDLDHFKEINDSLGHKHGDSVLKIIASRLEEIVRKGDFVARFGGDEFTTILEDIKNMDNVITKVQQMMEILNAPITINEHIHYLTFSIGISLFPNDGETAEVLLKNSDASMYKAKEEGRNTYVFYEQDLTRKAFERVLLATNLRQALNEHSFEIYYQPQVNAITGKIIGMEGLIRWKHETKGMIYPSKFILIAEDNGMIIEIDRWMMQEGIQQVSQWYKQGLNPGVLSLNLSIKQLQAKDFISILKQILLENECDPGWIELEITESQIMNNPEYSIEILQQLSDLGIKLAIDDFGTGYSSLSYLKRLPIDKLKIDQSFIRDIPTDKDDMAIVETIITLSKSLKLEVIAEGVETEAQKDFLIEHDCLNIQGFYYSKPVSKEEIQEMLEFPRV